jgi:hypothetical protein
MHSPEPCPQRCVERMHHSRLAVQPTQCRNSVRQRANRQRKNCQWKIPQGFEVDMSSTSDLDSWNLPDYLSEHPNQTFTTSYPRNVARNSAIRLRHAHPSALQPPNSKLNLRIRRQIPRSNTKNRKRLIREEQHSRRMNSPIDKDLQHRTINHTLDIPNSAIIDIRNAELARPEDIVCEPVGMRAIKPERGITAEKEARANGFAGDGA